VIRQIFFIPPLRPQECQAINLSHTGKGKKKIITALDTGGSPDGMKVGESQPAGGTEKYVIAFSKRWTKKEMGGQASPKEE